MHFSALAGIAFPSSHRGLYIARIKIQGVAAATKFFGRDDRCFRHQLLLPHPYLVLTKPLRLDIQCQRAASVKIGWKYLDD